MKWVLALVNYDSKKKGSWIESAESLRYQEKKEVSVIKE